jgi:hypothetical protein
MRLKSRKRAGRRIALTPACHQVDVVSCVDNKGNNKDSTDEHRNWEVQQRYKRHYMPSVVENGKRGEKECNNKGNERREIDGNTTERHDEVETTKGNDQAGTKMGAERSKRKKDKSED